MLCISKVDRIPQRSCKEVVRWRALRYPNVLPLLGVTIAEGRFVMVSEWTENGNIGEFSKAHTDVKPLGLVCFRLKP